MGGGGSHWVVASLLLGAFSPQPPRPTSGRPPPASLALTLRVLTLTPNSECSSYAVAFALTLKNVH